MTSDMRVSLLTGGDDPNYAFPLAASLADQGVQVEFVRNDAIESAADLKRANICNLNLRGSQDPRAPFHSKGARVPLYHQKLLAYDETRLQCFTFSG